MAAAAEKKIKRAGKRKQLVRGVGQLLSRRRINLQLAGA
jgi:hypothetical protein